MPESYDEVIIRERPRGLNALLLSVFVVLLVCVGLYYYLYQPRLGFFGDTTPEETATTPTAEDLLLQNQLYQSAGRSLASGDVKTARGQYSSLLREVSDPGQQGLVQYRIALTYVIEDPQEAIRLFKEVAANEAVPTVERAYAVQRLALMLSRTSDPTVVPAIFSTEPYAAWYDPNDVDLSLRRVFEYALTFYPLAVSEVRVANWLANEILEAKDTPEFAALVEKNTPIINGHLERADADIARTRTITGAKDFIPEALYMKALILARLKVAGLPYEYEPAMKEALNAGLAQGLGFDGSARFAYAGMLFRHEEGREAEALRLLEPMIADIDDYASFKRFFTNERNNVLNQKQDLVDMALAWPSFKSLLLSLGWQESDFVPAQ